MNTEAVELLPIVLPLRDRVRAEPAGPRLFEWVAVHAMNWHREGENWVNELGGVEIAVADYDPTKSPAESWEVLWARSRRGWAHRIQRDGNGHEVRLTKGDLADLDVARGGDVIVRDDDLYLAICKAVLLIALESRP